MKLSRLVGVSLALVLAFVFATIATEIINNPDLENYTLLLGECSRFETCTVEPMLWFVVNLVELFQYVFFIDNGVFLLYFLYQFTIIMLVFFGVFRVLKSSCKSGFFVILWALTFAPLHALIQIRYGLAMAICFYLLSFVVVGFGGSVKMYAGAFLAFLSHLCAAFVFVMIKYARKEGSLLFHILLHFVVGGGIFILTTGVLQSVLPSFLAARLSGYIGAEYSIDLVTIVFGVLLYFSLLLWGSVDKKRFNDNLVLYSALGYLPYLVAPTTEIFIRLGMPFQYLFFLVVVCRLRPSPILNAVGLLFFSYKAFVAQAYLWSLL